MSNMSQRSRVLNLYRTLLHLGKHWPAGFNYFRQRLHMAFFKNREETDPTKIEEMIRRGEFVAKEIEALYMLKKYRTLKRRYYSDN
ncbi:electron transfer flavoprotein regulatory factor 1 isoform X2 [Euwallacea fornicatus]|uniref:electron transfer flavoprotein regulatory factor 1 isoform X2 n=1 Tax=Euwallacea fornicatus TaxID=995702 RepID=UPI00338F7F0D